MQNGEAQRLISAYPKVKVKVKVKSCLTLSDPMDCSLQAPLSTDVPGKSTGVGCHCLLRKGTLNARPL